MEHRLQIFVHEAGPCELQGFELERDAHVDGGVKICLPERPQLPPTTRQMVQNAATREPVKDLSNGRPANAVLLRGCLLSQQDRHTFEAHLYKVIGDDFAPVRWFLRRRCRTAERTDPDNQPSIILLLQILL